MSREKELKEKLDKLEGMARRRGDKNALNEIRTIGKELSSCKKEQDDGVDLSWKEAGLGVGLLTGNPLGSIVGFGIGAILDGLFGTHKPVAQIVQDTPRNLVGIMKYTCNADKKDR